jgi:hypothetical protein
MLDDDDEPRRSSPWLGRVLFVASAGLFAAMVRFAWHRPPLLIAGAIALVAYLGYRWWSAKRLARMLRRGDVERVIAHWAESFDRVPHAETMAPLMTATALAAFGRVEEARKVLAIAERGPAWEAAIEHRLFLDALLSTFEGDAPHAREQVERLVALPMPDGELRERVASLRGALAALVRAFTHSAVPGDLDRLESASEKSPLVHWAMRYAAAIVAIDSGEKGRAATLIQGAPSWPAESAFRAFHDELTSVLAS